MGKLHVIQFAGFMRIIVVLLWVVDVVLTTFLYAVAMVHTVADMDHVNKSIPKLVQNSGQKQN